MDICYGFCCTSLDALVPKYPATLPCPHTTTNAKLATGWARCMSSIGSLERLLQLHDRGTLPVPRRTPHQPPVDASGRPAGGLRRRLRVLRCCGWLDAAPFGLDAGPSGRSEAAEAGGGGKAGLALEVSGVALAEDGGLCSMMGGVALRDAAILGRGKAKAAPLRHLEFEVRGGWAGARRYPGGRPAIACCHPRLDGCT
jgi:hypothetical protein